MESKKRTKKKIRQLVQSSLQAPTAHHEGHPLLPVWVLGEAPHEEDLGVLGPERDRASLLLRALLLPVRTLPLLPLLLA